MPEALSANALPFPTAERYPCGCPNLWGIDPLAAAGSAAPSAGPGAPTARGAGADGAVPPALPDRADDMAIAAEVARTQYIVRLYKPAFSSPDPGVAASARRKIVFAIAQLLGFLDYNGFSMATSANLSILFPGAAQDSLAALDAVDAALADIVSGDGTRALNIRHAVGAALQALGTFLIACGAGA